MNSGIIAIVAASIGAGSVLLSQWVTYILTRNKEINSLKKKLISEERSFAFLINAFQQELATYDACVNYEYQSAVIFADTDKGELSHKRHYEYEEKAMETQNKVNTYIADYFKTIAHFTTFIRANPIIEEELKKIRDFQPTTPNRFLGITDYDRLVDELIIEKIRLKKDYAFYTSCFDKINNEMKLNLK